MSSRDYQEFITMLLIENRALLESDKGDFLKFLQEHYSLKNFNNRYRELLDQFMNQYASNNAEKSEINL